MNLKTQIKPELWAAISKPYESGIYKNAILESIHFLSAVLREKADVDGDGASLVGQALGGNEPRLLINKFQTESEKNEQKGFEQILRGIYQGIRNPRSHDQWEDVQAKADAIILFIDYLLDVIDAAKEPFTIEEWVTKVFDPYFVPSTEYASLLVAEIPSKKKLEALIVLFRRKLDGNGYYLRYVISALVAMLDEQMVREFVKIVSEEFRDVRDHKAIKASLQILPFDLWVQIDKAPRLRVEHILISALKSGQYSVEQEKLTDDTGWLATWGKDFFELFISRSEIQKVILDKLRGNPEDRAYIFKFYLTYLSKLFSGEDWLDKYRNGMVAEAIQDSFIEVNIPDYREHFSRHLSDAWWSLSENWRIAIKEGLQEKTYPQIDWLATISVDEEDIPF